MSRFRSIGLVFLVLAAFSLFADVLWAGEVICPVCGKSFSDETKTCPNDGTDLKSMGIPIKKDESKPEQAEETEDEPAPPKSHTEGEESSKYKRVDRGAARRTTKSDEVNYKDRESRIAKKAKPRPPDDDAEERARQAAWDEEDRALIKEYEKRRSLFWEQRERAREAELEAANDREKARLQLLNSLGAPFTSLGYRLFFMKEDDDPGFANTAEIDVNLARYKLRAGLSSLIGVRTLPHRDDLLFLEQASVGFQWPRRFSPYFVIRGGIGVMFSERFGEDLDYLLGSVGAEVGIDSWITPWIAVTPSFGYIRCMVENAYWDSFTFKMSVGF